MIQMQQRIDMRHRLIEAFSYLMTLPFDLIVIPLQELMSFQYLAMTSSLIS